MKNNIKEITLILAIIITSILLLNPFDFWMPNMIIICILVTMLALFALFAGLVLREKSQDERDDVHRGLAGRNAFLSGSFVIIIGIVIQGYAHEVDTWLVIALITMIMAKVATRIWTDKNL